MPDSQVGSVVQIGEMSETELVEIYKEKSGISELLKPEREEIIKIIEAVSSHTMLLILLARLANQKGFTPSEMTRLLTENGLFSLNWFVSIENRNVAIMDYLGSVIDVEKLTKSEALCLLLMAVMPDEGVRKKVFLESFIHVHASDVDHLLSLGLISEQGNDSTINISNLVREVIIGKEEGNGSLFEEMGEELVEGIFLWSTHQDYQIEYMMSLAEIISGNVIRLSINSRSLVGFVWTTFFASLGHSINYEPGKSIAYLKKFLRVF